MLTFGITCCCRHTHTYTGLGVSHELSLLQVLLLERDHVRARERGRESVIKGVRMGEREGEREREQERSQEEVENGGE